MIKYGDLVQYIKENHINWDTDLFDVLRGFFGQMTPAATPMDTPKEIVQQELIFSPKASFVEPPDEEYSVDDLLTLLSN